MKRILNYFTAIILGLASFGIISCQKQPINGNLDGQWEVMEVTPKPTVDLVQNRLFYNFSLHVCQLTFYGDYFLDGEIVYDGQTLWINFPYSLDPYQKGVLTQYGITSNPVTFSVDFPDKKTLILSNDDTTVVLRKF